MSRLVRDWDDAAADVYTYMHEKKRTFSSASMLALVDDLCLRGSATQSEIANSHGSEDFVATTIGHVTTAIHGRGSVPKIGGWYSTSSNPHTYHINPSFREAWKRKRRLPDSQPKASLRGELDVSRKASSTNALKLNEDALCRIFAEAVKDSHDFASWLITCTKFCDQAPFVRLLLR